MSDTSLLLHDNQFSKISRRAASRWHIARTFFSGMLLPLGFAPFHIPGLAILSLALLFLALQTLSVKRAFKTGFLYGLGFFSLGVSWIFVSIHDYGHLNTPLTAAITLLFIAYLALFIGFISSWYALLKKEHASWWNAILFSTLWCCGEVLRAYVFGGFPWLLLGFGQMDSPLHHLLPLFGVFGVSWITCLLASLLGLIALSKGAKRYTQLIVFVALLLSPLMLSNKQWTTKQQQPLSVGVIQANLSMRDKWDESLFWQLLDHYHQKIQQLLGKKQLIVMPESAIPLPSNYISDFLETLDQQAKQMNSAILLGIPHPTRANESLYYNALLGLGHAEGIYFKQHLVAFGEFTPPFLSQLTESLALPLPNMRPGPPHQSLITVNHQPIASLICYELAYPELLRQQLPDAQWIVSISDDGWFGHSFAVYQHLQMAQAFSKLTGRDQIVANNDGLSAIIDATGHIAHALAPFSAGILEASIQPMVGSSPWSLYGDKPIQGIFLLMLLPYVITFIRRYLHDPSL